LRPYGGYETSVTAMIGSSYKTWQFIVFVVVSCSYRTGDRRSDWNMSEVNNMWQNIIYTRVFVGFIAWV